MELLRGKIVHDSSAEITVACLRSCTKISLPLDTGGALFFSDFAPEEADRTVGGTMERMVRPEGGFGV